MGIKLAVSLDSAISDWYGNQMRKEAGNALWKYEHVLGKYLPKDRYTQLRAFEALRTNVELFPCEKCATHGVEWIDSNPFDPDSETFADYTCRFHNVINSHLKKPIVNCGDSKFHQDIEEESYNQEIAAGREDIYEVSPSGKEDLIVESVPYASFDVGLSIPLSPLPMSPSINISTGQDWPFTVFPLPRKVIRDISNSWIPPIDELAGVAGVKHSEEFGRLRTPKELFDDLIKEK